MHGRQYYYGLSLAAACKVSDNFSAAVGLRGIYASCNYYGYVRERQKVGNMPLYACSTLPNPMPPTSNSAATKAVGLHPFVGVDYKTGRWNFSAKYELKTRIRLNNKSVNQAPSIGNLPTISATHTSPTECPKLPPTRYFQTPAIQGSHVELEAAVRLPSWQSNRRV